MKLNKFGIVFVFTQFFMQSKLEFEINVNVLVDLEKLDEVFFCIILFYLAKN